MSRNQSHLETSLAQQLHWVGLVPQREFRFQPPRRWRFDFAFPDQRLAIEVEGGIWNGGRHVRGKGFIKDVEKYNAAVLGGWRVLRFTGEDVSNGRAIQQIEHALKGEPVSA